MNQWFKVKRLKYWFISYKHAAFHFHLIDSPCRLLVVYCDVFISCLDSHSDGTHSLQRIHWWANDGMLRFCKSVLIKKQTLHIGWPEGEYILSKFFVLWVNCSFKISTCCILSHKRHHQISACTCADFQVNYGKCNSLRTILLSELLFTCF